MAIALYTPDITEASFMKRTTASTMAITGTASTIPIELSVEDESQGDMSVNGSNQFVADKAGSFKLGACVAFSSNDQRVQHCCEVFINGVGQGVLRGSSYIRNSGAIASEYWVLEISTEPFKLNANDTVELKVGQITGSTYAFGGSETTALHGSGTMIWFERITSITDGTAGEVNAPINATVVAKTADYTFVEGDLGRVFDVDTTSGDVTLTIPDGLPTGWWCSVVLTEDTNECIFSAGNIVGTNTKLTILGNGATVTHLGSNKQSIIGLDA